MSIYVGDKKATVYHGDHHPAAMYGPDEGIQTTGKNLFDILKVNTNGHTVIVKDGILYVTDSPSSAVTNIGLFSKICSDAKIGESYVMTLKTTGTGDRSSKFYLGGANRYISSGKPFILTKEDRDSWIGAYAFDAGGDLVTTAAISNIQLELGSTPTPYEPYTGGKPGVYHSLVRYAGFDKAKVSGTGRVEIGDQPYKAALPSVKVFGQGEQKQYPEVPAQTAGIVSIPDMEAGRPLKAVSEIIPRQEGSGDPSPDNPRNFIPWTGAELTVCGENLANPDRIHNSNAGQNYILFGKQTGKTGFPAKAGVPYTVTFESAQKTAGLYVNEFITNESLKTVYNSDNMSFEFPSNTEIILRNYYNPSVLDGVKINLNIGSKATPYTPYTGTTYTAQFGQEVYSGFYDWNAGELQITGKLFNLRVADMNNSDSSPGWRYIGNELGNIIGNNPNTDIRVELSSIGRVFMVNAKRDSDNALYIYPTDLTQSQWKEKYPDLTVQVYLPYREDLRPAPIKLTPQQIRSISGLNNIYSGTGDTTVSAPAGPSPDFPVEPVFLEGADIQARGKNLYSTDYVFGDFGSVQKVQEDRKSCIKYRDDKTIVKNVFPGRYCIKFCAKVVQWKPGSMESWILTIYYHDGEKHQIRQEPTSSWEEQDFITPLGKTVIAVGCTIHEYRNHVYIDLDTFQIELADSFTPYEPFFNGGTAQLPILRALPDGSVKDEIDLRTGKIVRRIWEEVYDGSPDEGWSQWGAGYYTSIRNGFDPSGYYVHSNGYNTVGTMHGSAGDPVGTIYFSPQDHAVNVIWSHGSDVPKFVRELQASPIKIWYALATPIIEHIDPQLLRQHPGYTQLIQQGGFRATEIEAECYKELP